jgi:hypothetical protein
MSDCLKKAGELCPGGYETLAKRHQEDTAVMYNSFTGGYQTMDSDDREMVIRCK